MSLTPGTLYSYLIQTSDLQAGRMRVILFSTINNLVVPNFQTLDLNFWVNSRVDAGAGLIELEHVDIQYREDYDHYSEGFWFKVLNAYCELQFFLDEGAGNQHFYWGRALPNQTVIHELDLTPGKYQRVGTIQTMSILGKMQDFTVQQIINGVDAGLFESITHLDGTPTGGLALRIQDFLASFLKTVFSQSTFDAGDIIVRGFDFDITDSTPNDFGALYFLPRTDAVTTYGYFNPTEWPATYSTAFDLFVAICQSFALIPRHYYDTVANRHRVELLTRGRSYTLKNTFGVPAESDFSPRVEASLKNVTVNCGHISTLYYSGGQDKATYTDMPNGFRSDLQVTMFWGQYTGGEYAPYSDALLYKFAPGWFNAIGAGTLNKWKFWDYNANAWSSECEPGLAMARYLYRRLGIDKRGYARTYNSLQSLYNAASAQTNTTLLRNHDITDGVASRTFYATEIQKNAFLDQSKVVWTEI